MSDARGGRLVGHTISHYRVVAPLGAGGMGVVYRGEDVRLGRPVAIKFVADDFANDTQAVARLRAEARAASALNHPNICTIYDIGTEEGHPFIVMELMEGQTLRERLTRSRLKIHELVDIGIQTADALQGAHSEGIIHRDIKPANIFLLTGRGHVKILDFGLAKLTDGRHGPDSTTLASADLTAAGTTLGTVAYMSPEQASGEDLDGRTDLFSLGVVLYECATGRQPFEGKTHAVILEAILNRSPAPPGLLNPELPARLQEVITTCLEKDRELRYQSAADLRADLKRVRRDLESGRAAVTQTATVPIAQVSGHANVPTASSAAKVTAPSSVASVAQTGTTGTRSAMWVVGAVALVAALAAGTYALWPRAAMPGPSTQQSESTSNESVQGRLSLARSSLAAGNYRAAQVYAADVLALDPNQAEALRIRQEVATTLAKFDELLATARAQLGAGDLQGASRALTAARDLDPTSPAVSELASALAARVPGTDPVAASSADRLRAANPRSAPTSPPPAANSPPRIADRRTSSSASAPASPEPPPAQAAASPAAPPPPPTPNASAPPIATTPPPATPVEPAPAPAPARGAGAAAASTVDARSTSSSARSTAADDDAAVRRVVMTYARAIEGKDLTLFRSVKPNITRDEERRLQDGFRAVTSQQVHLTIGSVDIRDEDATVVAQRRDLIEAGGRRQAVESRQTFRLTRTQGGWVITDIR